MAGSPKWLPGGLRKWVRQRNLGPFWTVQNASKCGFKNRLLGEGARERSGHALGYSGGGWGTGERALRFRIGRNCLTRIRISFIGIAEARFGTEEIMNQYELRSHINRFAGRG